VSAPAHLAEPSLVQRLSRLAFWVLGVAIAGMFATGIWLAFEYKPGGGAVRGLHAALGVVAVVSALVGAVCTVADNERSTAGILPSIFVLLVVGGLYLTGPTLAWDEITANGPIAPKGVTVGFDDNVGVLTQGDRAIKADDYRRVAFLHTIGMPFLVLVMGGAGLWAVRRTFRDD